MDEKSKVYILVDDLNRVLRCEGGYTMGNIDNTSEWIFIDEGEGDKFNLCQSHYFSGGLYNEDGVCRYIYENKACRLRTAEEMAADVEKLEPAAPTIDERVTNLELDSAETREALEMILNGVTE